jgi:glycosyltransferase involved in cell wall biosynthesis
MAPLNILHVFRAPVGGLFRHVVDLAQGQIERGHRVGLIADNSTGGVRANAVLAGLAPRLALGINRIAMPRQLGPNDISAIRNTSSRIASTAANVVHGHGAKGGAYARLAQSATSVVRAYTPHGGSLHYNWDTLIGKFYLTAERLLMRRGDLYLFESEFSAETFHRKVGTPRGIVRVVHNGVSRQEFEPIVAQPGATDLVFLGELRQLKGVDVLIDAIAQLRDAGRAASATLVGGGADREALRAQAERLGLSAAICFQPAMSARQAQALGRIMVVPSRFESLPYVVLEAAAGGMPLIATRVGGVPEIFGPLSDALVPPGDAGALAQAIARAIDYPDTTAERARRLREFVAASFSVDSMVEGVLDGYRAALENPRESGGR